MRLTCLLRSGLVWSYMDFLRGSFSRDKAVNLLVDAKANPNPDVMVSQLCTVLDTLKSSISITESKPISMGSQQDGTI